jgi:hypothetical protein
MMKHGKRVVLLVLLVLVIGMFGVEVVVDSFPLGMFCLS